MKNVYMFLILGMCLLSITSIGFTSASYDEIGPYIQGECVNLPQVADATSCNITAIRFPVNSSYAVRNVEMDKSGSSFNYTFCSTSVLGTYIVEGICDDTVWVYDFEVTTNGIPISNKIPMFLLITAIILFVIGIVIESPPTGFFSGVLLLMAGMYLMIYGLGDIADLYTQSFALVIIALGSIVTILAGFSWVED